MILMQPEKLSYDISKFENGVLHYGYKSVTIINNERKEEEVWTTSIDFNSTERKQK